MNVPRVHEVLSILFPHSLDFVGQEHLERGAFLHEQMEIWVNNQVYLGGSDQDIPKEIIPIIQWFQRERIEFEPPEERITHKYGFMATPDLPAIWKGRPVFFDHKFSEIISLQNIVQGNAYMLFGRPVYFLQCKRDGKLKVIKCKKDPRLVSAFLSALNVWKFRESHKPKTLTLAEAIQQAEDVKEQLCQTQM